MNFIAFIVGIIAVLFSFMSIVVQRYVHRVHSIKEKQIIINEKNKLLREIHKSKDVNDPKVKAELDTLQEELMKETMAMMKGNLSYMFFMMIFGLIIISILAIYVNKPFPVGTIFGISPVFVWYILISIVSSLIYRGLFSYMEKNYFKG